MGVLSLHNECPPTNYGLEEAKEVCRGMVIGEEGTSALLTVLADCLNTLAAMDDTVGHTVSAWNAWMDKTAGVDPMARSREAQQSYQRGFQALDSTIERIDFAVRRYRDLATYARSAKEKGRGVDFQTRLAEITGSDFDTLVNQRIDGLRRLKIRLKLLKQLQESGLQMLLNRDYTEFFLTFMQPLRDMAIEVNELYNEVIRGALASHRTLFQVGQLVGEEIAAGSLREVLQPVGD